MSGDTAVVGAHYGFAAGVVTGAAYVFVRSAGTWQEEQKLTAFDGTAHDDFGWAVGVAGDVAIGGGDADDETAGSAHVYLRKNGVWYHQHELTVRGGGKMHVRMLCLGRHWNGVKYAYEPTRTDFDGLPVPPLPSATGMVASGAPASHMVSVWVSVSTSTRSRSAGHGRPDAAASRSTLPSGSWRAGWIRRSHSFMIAGMSSR